MNTPHIAQISALCTMYGFNIKGIFLQSILSLATYLENQMQLILDLLRSCLEPGNNSRVCMWAIVEKQPWQCVIIAAYKRCKIHFHISFCFQYSFSLVASLYSISLVPVFTLFSISDGSDIWLLSYYRKSLKFMFQLFFFFFFSFSFEDYTPSAEQRAT